MKEAITRSLHDVLTSQFTELPVTQKSTIIRNGSFLLALYGVEGEPLLAFGTVKTGRRYLGTPKLLHRAIYTKLE